VSATLAGALALAVVVHAPQVAAVPAIVYVTTPPLGKLASVVLRSPAPLAGQAAPPLALHVQFQTPFASVGKAADTRVPSAAAGPSRSASYHKDTKITKAARSWRLPGYRLAI